VRKRHTSQFKQLNVSTRDDRGYSEKLQRTNLHTYTQGPFQISSVPWAVNATVRGLKALVFLYAESVRGLYHLNFHLLILAGTMVAL